MDKSGLSHVEADAERVLTRLLASNQTWHDRAKLLRACAAHARCLDQHPLFGRVSYSLPGGMVETLFGAEMVRLSPTTEPPVVDAVRRPKLQAALAL